MTNEIIWFVVPLIGLGLLLVGGSDETWDR